MRAAHWAPIGAPLLADAEPPSSAPRAGGSKKAPPPAADWEWDLTTRCADSSLLSGNMLCSALLLILCVHLPQDLGEQGTATAWCQLDCGA